MESEGGEKYAIISISKDSNLRVHLEGRFQWDALLGHLPRSVNRAPWNASP